MNDREEVARDGKGYPCKRAQHDDDDEFNQQFSKKVS